MNETTTPGAPLTLDELARLAVFLSERGHRRTAVDILTRVFVALVPVRHPGARPTGTGWPT